MDICYFYEIKYYKLFLQEIGLICASNMLLLIVFLVVKLILAGFLLKYNIL